MSKHKSQYGFTLVELMIALVLGLLITGAVIQLFLSNKQTYRMTEAYSLLQDNGRFALAELTTNIRSAGYVSCRPIKDIKVINIAKDSTIILNEHNVIKGNEASSASWTPSLPAKIANKVLPGTDVVTVQRSESCGGTLVGNVNANNANIQIAYPNSCNIEPGDIVMISDCEDAHIFKATTASSQSKSKEDGKQTISFGTNNNNANHFCKSYPSSPSSGSCAKDQEKNYSYDAEITLIKSVTYFIRKNSYNTPSLYRYEADRTSPDELIEGVQDMQIRYGIDDNHDSILDRTATADTIEAAGEWDRVISADISLLLTTIDKNLTPSEQKINFNNKELTVKDGRILRVFSTTIAIRNQVQ